MSVDSRAVASLYEAELHAIGEMLTTVGVPENDDDGYPLSDRIRLRWYLDQTLEKAAESERLRAALTEMLESFTEPEDDNDILRGARAALAGPEDR